MAEARLPRVISEPVGGAPRVASAPMKRRVGIGLMLATVAVAAAVFSLAGWTLTRDPVHLLTAVIQPAAFSERPDEYIPELVEVQRLIHELQAEIRNRPPR